MTLTGFYVGNYLSDYDQTNSWNGEDMDILAAHTGRANWSDWVSSIGWQIGNLGSVDATLRWSIPMFANGGDLASAAGHAYDNYYVQAAQKLVAAYGTSQPIIVRTGEEFNGNWMPWSAAGHEDQYAQAYRNFVDAFRSVGGNFKFEWNVNNGQTGVDLNKAYPGDGYVDYVGMDFYWDSQQVWSITDPLRAFDYMKTNPVGLQWLEDFAAAHGKQSAYSEWGINSPNAAPYIQLVKMWFDEHNPAYEIYWNSNADFAGKLSDGSYGDASTTFHDLFGDTDPLPAPAPAPAPAPSPDVVADVTTTLAAGQLNLTLTGSGAIDGTGNTPDNHITGNVAANRLVGMDGNDLLDGGLGNDTLVGGLGNDTYVVDSIYDTVIELPGQGFDTIASSVNYSLAGLAVEALTLTGTTALYATGNELDNVLTGNAANNVLTGGAGADQMIGGAGNDSYDVDNIGDTVIEAAGGGVDSVRASVSFSLAGQDIENLFLTGAAYSATGNALANTIGGTDLANDLDGGQGADLMLGYKGDDIYHVDNVGDIVSEKPLSGIDSVLSTISYTLGYNVENLTLIGPDARTATGNNLANTVSGNEAANVIQGLDGNDVLSGGGGNDVIAGGDGNDRMSGGSGADLFYMTGRGGSDTITDFELGIDKIQIDSGKDGFDKIRLSSDWHGGTVVTWGVGKWIDVLGVTPDRLSASDFVFAQGMPAAAGRSAVAASLDMTGNPVMHAHDLATHMVVV